MHVTGSSPTAERKRNLRTGLILASVALAFFVGFIAKIVLFSQP